MPKINDMVCITRLRDQQTTKVLLLTHVKGGDMHKAHCTGAEAESRQSVALRGEIIYELLAV